MKQSVFRSRILRFGIFLSALLLLAGAVFCKSIYQKQQVKHLQADFDRFLDEIFVDELKSDPLSLHYLLTNSSAYGIYDVTPVLTPPSSEDATRRRSQLSDMRTLLTEFPHEALTPEQQQTYDCLLFLIDNRTSLLEYEELANPLSPQSGIQQQLPFLLSEYRFDSRKDMENYLLLLDSVYPYMESLCTLIQNRISKKHIPLVAVQESAEQCLTFLNTPPEENILLVSFDERLSTLEYLDEIEVAVYQMKNRYRVETEILPAYTLLYELLSEYTASNKNMASEGLSSYLSGKDYYTLLAQDAASSDLSVPQMKALLEQYHNNTLARMKQLAAQNPEIPKLALDSLVAEDNSLYSELPGDTPEDTIRFLRQNSLRLLPSLNNIENLRVNIKTVSPCLQQMSAPAMYLLSPLDSYKEHTVYLNPAFSGNNCYTTLAHETFPGHLCARVCFLSENPHPIRALTSFIGWDEGWASLAELYALNFLASDSVTEFLCCYEISALCLYGLSDIGIHYDGWDKETTLAFWDGYGVDSLTAHRLWSLVVSEPAYYLPYSMGLVQMLELRRLAISVLGPDYTESEFCSALLSFGPMPFPVCEKYLHRIAPD